MAHILCKLAHTPLEMMRQPLAEYLAAMPYPPQQALEAQNLVADRIPKGDSRVKLMYLHSCGRPIFLLPGDARSPDASVRSPERGLSGLAASPG